MLRTIRQIKFDNIYRKVNSINYQQTYVKSKDSYIKFYVDGERYKKERLPDIKDGFDTWEHLKENEKKSKQLEYYKYQDYIDEIFNYYISGFSIEDVSKITQKSISSIHNMLCGKTHIDFYKRHYEALKKRVLKESEPVIKLYLEGKSSKDISKILNITTQKVTFIINGNGVYNIAYNGYKKEIIQKENDEAKKNAESISNYLSRIMNEYLSNLRNVIILNEILILIRLNGSDLHSYKCKDGHVLCDFDLHTGLAKSIKNIIQKSTTYVSEKYQSVLLYDKKEERIRFCLYEGNTYIKDMESPL